MAEILRKFKEERKAGKRGEKKGESAAGEQFARPMPLRDVVAHCEKHWYEQTLRGAKSGDVAMQTLVGQMLCSGYGAEVDVKEGISWLRKAAETDHEARGVLASLASTGRKAATGSEFCR